ncbi:MAG TPA: Na+/H+ antiporter subunit E [Propionibacterium sp.]|jgi:multicomponent Na+:H+ antiporter subunit E|nr:Na+/H+ antiporter subunit E [Propionibacterium sp.]
MSTVRSFRPGSLIALGLLWLLMSGSWTWGSLAMGLLMGTIVLLAFPMPRRLARFRFRPIPLAWLTITFLANLFWSSFIVAWMAMRPSGITEGRVVAIRLHDTDDFRRTVTAEMTSLVPGTVVIDLDPQGHLLIHIIDHCDDARLLAEARRIHRLERRVANAFGAPPLEGCGVGPQEEVRDE